MKVCSKCRRELEETSFVKSIRYNDGLYPSCKDCRREVRLARLRDNPLCSKCKTNPHAQNHSYCLNCIKESKIRSKTGDVRPRPPKFKTCSRCGIRPRGNGRMICDDCKKMCSKCGNNIRTETSCWCQLCINLYCRERRRRLHGTLHARMSKEQKIKKAARASVRMAILLGKLKRLPCQMCGSLESQAHHHNGYEKDHRLDVMWLCRKHHRDFESGKFHVDVRRDGVVVVNQSLT